MRDIRRPYRNSKSNNDIEIKRHIEATLMNLIMIN